MTEALKNDKDKTVTSAELIAEAYAAIKATDSHFAVAAPQGSPVSSIAPPASASTQNSASAQALASAQSSLGVSSAGAKSTQSSQETKQGFASQAEAAAARAKQERARQERAQEEQMRQARIRQERAAKQAERQFQAARQAQSKTAGMQLPPPSGFPVSQTSSPVTPQGHTAPGSPIFSTTHNRTAAPPPLRQATRQPQAVPQARPQAKPQPQTKPPGKESSGWGTMIVWFIIIAAFFYFIFNT